MVRLVQIIHPDLGRRIAVVEEPTLRLVSDFSSVYALGIAALQQQGTLVDVLHTHLSEETLAYDAVYQGSSPWQLLPAFDHPDSPFYCLVSGTGLTHQASAGNRQQMHEAAPENLTDSMRMYRWGLEGGRPATGKIGVQPEWFYKGNGSVLKAHHQLLEVPPFGNDGGEEPEIAGAYLIDQQGQPYSIGFCTANEFSDHVMEKKNYLYLAPSKLRYCAIGPELVVGGSFEEVKGAVSIVRENKQIWKKDIQTGEKQMVHSLANLEYHHFKYPMHRIPGQAHVHFLGAADFSFGHNIALQDGDLMEIHWEGFGRPLINPLKIWQEKESIIKVRTL